VVPLESGFTGAPAVDGAKIDGGGKLHARTPVASEREIVMRGIRLCASAPILGSALLSSGALGQSCQSHWDAALGTPGVSSSGYVAPITAWNDGSGSGETLYIGGSFSAVGGYSTLGIARWSPSVGHWAAVGGGCYSTHTNYFLTAIQPYTVSGRSELAVGGFFEFAGGVANTSNLASWNGTRWASLANPVANGAIWAMAAWNGRLYAGGGFSQIGGTAASGVASYDGSAWSAMGSGMGGGFSPAVFSMKVFDDGSGEKLYAGGRFAQLGGVAGLIARWTGTVWEPVGGGVSGGDPTFSDIETMAVFDNGSGGGPALYVGGWTLAPSGASNCSVAEWNGHAWSAVGQFLGGRTTSLAAWDDGTGMALYAGGTAQPGINYLAKLVGGQWVAFDGGVGNFTSGPPFPSVFGLGVWTGASAPPDAPRLVVGGDFDYVGSAQLAASGIVARTSCAAASCRVDLDGNGVVNIQDFLRYLQAFGTADVSVADWDGNGSINIQDFLAFLSAFAAGCP
jgi:hypothetical protein